MQEVDILFEVFDSIVGQVIKVDYILLLVQVQKVIGIGVIECMIGFVGIFVQMKFEVLDMLDSDQIMWEFVDQVGLLLGILLLFDELLCKCEVVV